MLGREELNAHGKANEKFKQALSYARSFIRDLKISSPTTTKMQTRTRQLHILFSGQDPRLWKPRFSSKQSTRLSGEMNKPKSTKLFQDGQGDSLSVSKERGGPAATLSPGGITEVTEPKTVSAGPRVHKLIPAFLSLQAEEASQEHLL